LSMS